LLQTNAPREREIEIDLRWVIYARDAESMIVALRRFVAIPTVSCDETKRGDCWTGAKFLKTLMEGYEEFLRLRLVAVTRSHVGGTDSVSDCSMAGWRSTGFECKLVQGREGKNPVVLGRLGAGNHKPTVVFYGHYDVFPAGRAGWRTDPFSLSGVDGYLYGRGTTDDKGPILAMLYAVQEWQCELLGSEQQAVPSGELPINIVFVIEGEEECDSEGFVEAVQENMAWFNDVAVILFSNTYWIGEKTVRASSGTHRTGNLLMNE